MNALENACAKARRLLSKAVQELGAPAKESEVVQPSEFAHGLLATPLAFSTAKQLNREPNEVAQKLAQAINASLPNEFFESASAVNGYVNFFASQQFFTSALGEALAGDYGTSTAGRGRTFVIEYSQPNVGKPFHVGHIRSTILGDAVANCLQACGWAVKRVNYLGDAGAQVAKLIVAAREFKYLPPMRDERAMLAYYVRIHKEIEERPQLEEKARQVMQAIESGDERTLGEVKGIREKSYEAFERNYGLLGVKFDVVNGESEFIQESKEIVSEALLKGIAFKDEKTGAVVADLEAQGLPNTILLRSNGTTLYFTRELGLADWKWREFKFDESLITTASEQNLYFKQFTAFLHLLGREYASRYKHLGFGLVTLQGERISTREGRVVLMEDVLNEAIKAVESEIRKRNLQYPSQEVQSISRIIGVGSVKFAFLKVSNAKNIAFDPVRAVSFEGDTGAYVQYTCVRAKNILRKGNVDEKNIVVPKGIEFNDAEKELISSLSSYPSTVAHVATYFEPHGLCDYLLKLSALFSEFYEKCPVLQAHGENEKQKRIAIVAATKNALQNGLALLGIQAPERM